MNHIENILISEIKQILILARQKAYSTINTAMIEAYWCIGKRIVEKEQLGEKRAEYGKKLITTIAKELTANFGKGFSERSIREYRQFYIMFPDLEIIWRTPYAESSNSNITIWRTVYAKLHWAHYQRIMRINNIEARKYYLKEAAENNWSIRTLDRNISTLYYERLLSSQVKEVVKNEMIENVQTVDNEKFDFIKNPMVLEFLNLPVNDSYTEKSFENALINNLQNFLLELGKGFSFVAKQQLVRTETSNFYIDLVFYNYILKCFVIIDLKTDRITHQDVGQLDMYVRMYDDLFKQDSDNSTIGILLCTETDRTIAKYSVLNDNKQLFANKYLAYLPSEAELVAEIEREKLIFRNLTEKRVK